MSEVAVQQQSQIERAQAAFAAAMAADALGSQVEFTEPAVLRRTQAAQLLQLQEGGAWQTLAGQPTADGELMLLQAQMLLYCRNYQDSQALQAYQYWLYSEPFALNAELQTALQIGPRESDFSVNALSRLTPLAILGVHFSLPQIAAWAMEDTALTQSSVLMQQVSALYAMALAKTIDQGGDRESLYQDIQQWASELKVEYALRHAIAQALFMPSDAELRLSNPALAAFQNLLFQLLYAKDLDEALLDTIRLGGDIGSNLVVVAAVFGALNGLANLPADWCPILSQCRPQIGVTGVDQPRAELFWPVDVLQLAQQLVELTPNED